MTVAPAWFQLDQLDLTACSMDRPDPMAWSRDRVPWMTWRRRLPRGQAPAIRLHGGNKGSKGSKGSNGRGLAGTRQ